jgi:response regulator RpfG family c-di-GMP phosphodiesterase
MLEAEKIKLNWDIYRDRVNSLFDSRSEQLNRMYDEFEDRMMMMPASSIAHYHNAFAGGYVDHVLRVMDCAEKLYESWQDMGADMSGYTGQEMLFAAMHHDLGKVGFPGEGNEVYQVETSDWHRKNMGRMYKHNENIPFTMVPDLSIFLLHKYNVPMSILLPEVLRLN